MNIYCFTLSTIILMLTACSSATTPSPSPTPVVRTPTSTATALPTEEVVNSALIDAYKTAFADPHKVLSETQLGTEIFPVYLEKHTSDKSVPVPGTTISFTSQTVNTIVKSINEYTQLVENTIGKKPSNFIVSWNNKQGDQFAFAIYGTEEVNGQKVMFWAADEEKAGTPDHPVLSFSPLPADFGVSSPRNIKLIQVPLPPNAPSYNLHAHWWTSKADAKLQRIPAIVITVSQLEFHLFNILKSQEEGIENGWISELRPKSEGLPDLGNNTWQIIALYQGKPESVVTIINADGSIFTVPTRKGGTQFAKFPIWSPDGKRIALQIAQANENYKYEIFTMNPDGSSPFQVTHMRPENMGHIAWSPDGKRMAFAVWFDTNNSSKDGLYVINAGGTGLTQLKETSDIVDLSWTPDSKGVVMYSHSGQRWVVPLDGSEPTQLPQIHLPQGCFLPTFSPDGKRIAFVCGEWFVETQIWAANADGSEPIQLTNIPKTRNNFPVWSPDSKYIAFNTNRYDDLELWVMKADGSDQTLLKAGPYFEVQWRP